MILRSCCSCNQSTSVPKCRTMDTHFRSMIPMAALASMCTLTMIAFPKSRCNVPAPRPSQVPQTTPYNSLSTLLLATKTVGIRQYVDAMASYHDTPSRCALPGLPASCPTGIGVNVHHIYFLIGVAPHQSRPMLQISPNSLQALHRSHGGLAHLAARLLHCVLDVRAVCRQVIAPCRHPAIHG